MEYIDDKFKIKSTKAMEKHITKITAIEVMCIKMADVVRVLWAVDNKLHHYDIKGSVIYIIKEDALQLAVDTVMNSVNPPQKEVGDAIKEWIRNLEEWVIVDENESISVQDIISTQNLEPFAEGHSFHLYDHKYSVEDETYRLIYSIDDKHNEPVVERLIKK